MTPAKLLEVRDVLAKTRKLFTDRSRWTQGVFARDRNGDEVSPTSFCAVCWCASGAIRHLSGSAGVVMQARQFLGGRLECRCISSTNDSKDGYERIMSGLAKAIAELDAEIAEGEVKT